MLMLLYAHVSCLTFYNAIMATTDYSTMSSATSDIYLLEPEKGIQKTTQGVLSQLPLRKYICGRRAAIRGFVGGIPEIIERITLMVSINCNTETNNQILY